MVDAQQRLLWFLADPSLSDQEFESIASLLRHGGGNDVVDDAWRVREAVRKKNWADVRRRLRREPKPIRYDDPLLDAVSTLLFDEAHLTARVALKSLAEVLGYREPLSPNLSLQMGVKRLRDQFDASEIVSAAQRVRNQIVHHSPDIPNLTWPLKKR